jgi:hypothetical protein
MPMPTNRDTLRSVLIDIGLQPVAWPLDDRHFRWAIAAAVPVWLALGSGLAGPLYRPAGAVAWASFLLIQPVIEETIFRGLLQGQWLRIRGVHRVAGFTTANWLASALFVAMHAFVQPPVWALAVVVPSLIYGHLRERFRSIWPSVAVHAVYNAGFALAAWMAR